MLLASAWLGSVPGPHRLFPSRSQAMSSRQAGRRRARTSRCSHGARSLGSHSPASLRVRRPSQGLLQSCATKSVVLNALRRGRNSWSGFPSPAPGHFPTGPLRAALVVCAAKLLCGRTEPVGRRIRRQVRGRLPGPDQREKAEPEASAAVSVRHPARAPFGIAVPCSPCPHSGSPP